MATKKTKKAAKRKPTKRESRGSSAKKAAASRATDYPRHSLEKALRIPEAILKQNAGRPCPDSKSAGFCGVGYHGPFRVEISSGIKYGFSIAQRKDRSK